MLLMAVQVVPVVVAKATVVAARMLGRRCVHVALQAMLLLAARVMEHSRVLVAPEMCLEVAKGQPGDGLDSEAEG
jgi:hypothetical protein